MEGLLGIPEWLVITLLVGMGLAITFGIAWRNTKRQIAATLARRPNPTKAKFMEMMRSDISEEAASFLWQTALPYLSFHKPPLTLHPDDDLVRDLPIDPDEISMDWPRDWAEARGFHESNLPVWPREWPVTIRNYGRWLDMGPQSQPPGTSTH